MIDLTEQAVQGTIEIEARAARPLATQGQPTGAPASRQLSVVEYAMHNGASPADVRALVELQIQMDNHKLAMLKQQDEREREQRKIANELAFRKAFAVFRGKNIVIPKTKHVDRGRGGSFDQAEYHVASTMLSPALSACGFSVRHDVKFGSKPWTTDGVVSDVPWVYVTCFLDHDGGHTEKLDLEGPPGDLAVNTPVQNMQVTGSFLKRQSLLAITGTATGGEDDEGRMRKPRGADREDEAPDDDSDVIAAGIAAARGGMKPLTAWWGSLTSKERGRLGKEFANMRRSAQQVDGGDRG